MELRWRLERACHFHGHLFVDGWAFSPSGPIQKVSVRLASGAVFPIGYGYSRPEAAEANGSHTVACGFSGDIPVGHPDEARCHALIFDLGSESLTLTIASIVEADPYFELFRQFTGRVAQLTDPVILEIGSRARSGNVNTDWLPAGSKYLGVDIVPGPNVDLVCDAHSLSTQVAHESVDAVFSISTMEHLAMPWKVVLELGKVLKRGGLAFFATHQSWPLHDEPHDYWRFSSHTWPVLLNEETGFALLDVAMGLPGSVLPHIAYGATVALDYQPAS